MTFGAVGSEMTYPEHAWNNLVFLYKSFTIPIAAAALGGMAVAARRRLSGALLHGLWLGLFLTFHSLVLGHYEARYLFPLFPPCYFFATVGLEAAASAFRRPAVRVAALCALLAWPAWEAADECRKFLDPFYHQKNFARALADRAVALSPDRRVVWLGPFYALHPAEYVFDTYDPVTYIYHVFSHTVHLYQPMSISSIIDSVLPYMPNKNPLKGVFPQPRLTYNVSDGEAVIMNLEPEPYTTFDVPAVLKPMVVERARVFVLTSSDHGRTFRSATSPVMTLGVRESKGKLVLDLEGWRDHAWFVFMESGGPDAKFIGYIDPAPAAGRLAVELAKLPDRVQARSFRLVSFDSVSVLSP
jgi:hypothetical protein